jgi:23S rRNA (cytosine1962-C5)-methyltransferase
VDAPLEDLVARAVAARADLLARLHAGGTDCYRLLHGVVEGRPGLAVDRYGPILLVQTWREPLAEGELDRIAGAVDRALGVALTAVWNHRGDPAPFSRWHDPALPPAPECREERLRYDARPRHRGRDPLLYLDFRAGRRRVRAEAEGRSVLNLFAYTCGIGVAGAAGGASRVLNVDFAGSSLGIGQGNAERNGLTMETLREDVLPVIRQLAGLPIKGRAARRKYTRLQPQAFDLVVLDPPPFAHSPFGAVDVVRDYPSLLKPTLLACKPGGQVLATNNVARVDEAEWHDVLRRCATKAGRPIRELTPLRPDADFPSPDDRPPLKMAWLHL